MKKGWEIKKLGDLCEVIAGQSPAGKYYNTDGNGVPFHQGKKEFGERFIGPPQKWTTHTKKIGKADDVLMSVRAPVGPINYATEDICIGRGLAAIRCQQNIDSDYLFYQLLHLQPTISGKEGAVFASINKADIANLPISWIPLPEQHRIVAILDEAFAEIAQAKAHAEKNLQNARELFESHLNAIFSQRGDGWEEKRLESITTKIGSGATPRGGGKSYKAEGISLIRSLNVHDLGFKYLKLAFIDDAQANALSNVEVRQNDVLLNITGASVARCCIVPEDVLPARVNQHVSIIRPVTEIIDAEFLHYLLISKPYKDQLLKTGEEGGSTRQAITKAQIQNFMVRYPPTIQEQREYVTKLDVVFGETQRFESIYQQKLNALEELKKSILHDAFRGEL